jgi:uncharacterized protein (TIGR02271 family)
VWKENIAVVRDASRLDLSSHGEEEGAVAMFGKQNEDPSRQSYLGEPAVIGIFSYPSDARRALGMLHERQFASEQLNAAFREPTAAGAATEDPTAAGSGAGHGSGAWFGQLRRIYRGDRPPVEREGDAESGAFASTQGGLEQMLESLELAPGETALLRRDLEHGGAIVIVHAGERNPEAQALMEARNGRILQSRSRKSPLPEPSGIEVVDSAPFAPPQPAQPDRIQLYGEVLRVRKEKVSSGDVHVRKEKVTRMETVQVPVTREHLVVEHSNKTGIPGGEGVIRIPLSEERVHIDKDTVLREEYKVGKQEVTHTEPVSDTVRRERLLIEDAHPDVKK